jgi:glyoxylase-like metal-dependent hydrolase (beta-lactamase superfamily II)/8-oxo-dGTP pyrophosphatase MutT (NUDIX family)
MLRFMGGWHAFPGGGISQSDFEVPIQGLPAGIDAPYHPADVPGADSLDLPPALVDGLLACTVRELFEETGILVHCNARTPPADALDDARTALNDKKKTFNDILGELDVALDASPLVYAGRWITPPISTIRFDARFFLLEWPSDCGMQPSIIPGELDHGEWIRPGEAIQRWRRAEVMIAQPMLHILRVMLREGPELGLDILRPGREKGPQPHRIEFRREISAIPLRTNTLPPATHTSAYLAGFREMILVDPASPFPDQLDALQQAVRAAGVRENGIVKAIWLTHHHPDHIGGVQAMRKALGVPVCAHPLTAERLESLGIEIDQTLHDGQTVVLAGDPPVTLQVLHTPGHARGHLCFYEPASRSLIAGDMVAGHSTIIIDPPEGDMDDYLHSLSKLTSLQPSTLLPGHGSMMANAVERLQQLYNHRLRREQQVLEAWKQGLRDPVEILPTVYTDISAHEYPLAERQIAAHIVRLQKLGMI